SYLSQHATPLHFGLGKATIVDRLEVSWPSGRRQSISAIKSRQMLRLHED
ncbi:ASPIC/UnbV domain-containing protein, partial [Edaphobacter sp.]